MQLEVGTRVKLKTFEECLGLSKVRNSNYSINLPEEMEPHFDRVVTIDGIGTRHKNYFTIKEDHRKWSFHIDWIEKMEILPNELFEL